jgi:uncharacterized membrane protein
LKFLYFGSRVRLGQSGPPILILYVIVPWIGLMMAGYAFGAAAEWPQNARRELCLKLGAGLTVLFILLRAFDVYGDPQPWRIKPAPAPTGQTSVATAVGAPRSPRPAPPIMPAAFRFLNTTNSSALRVTNGRRTLSRARDGTRTRLPS